MKKLMMLAAMAAMTLVLAIPVVAEEVSQQVVAGEVSQDSELEAESAEVEQTFEVANSGDNSNQCADASGVANTGNSQPFTEVLQYASEADDFEFEDGGSGQVLQFASEAGDFEFEDGDPDIAVSGSSTTTCAQQVNQSAAAG